MPKATQRYNLQAVIPHLAKEWHPTKNGSFNPRNVTPGSGKKVWWICGEGHEWEAAVYSRSRGSGCPYCNKRIVADNDYLSTSNPSLIREWHPTKNGILNPRNVTLGSGKKVWWICEEGHEWKATVKSRIKGAECPVCHKVVSKESSPKIKEILWQAETIGKSNIKSIQKNDVLRSYFPQMSSKTEFRKSERYRHQVTIILEDANSGSWSYAQTSDFSSSGMSFESEVAFKPGTKINITFDSPPFKSTPKIYSSIVRWCKELADDESIHPYGVGVKFI